MKDSGTVLLAFVVGVAVGAGAALLLAPQSGEETREWISDAVEDEAYRIKRKAKRSLDQVQDALERGEQTVTRVLKTGKTALDSLSAKLD
jgi:gas vesicle protein